MISNKLTPILFLLIIQSLQFNLFLSTPLKPTQQDHKLQPIFKDSILQPQFNDTEYNNLLSCANGLLTIVEFNISDRSNLFLKFQYDQLMLAESDISIGAQPNQSPMPKLREINNDQKYMIVDSGCLSKNETNSGNYYNELKVNIMDSNTGKNYQFQMLYNCQYNGRHKKFEYGYLLLTVMNAFIIVGVALHSRIWSIRYNQRPLRFELKWYRLLILLLIFMGVFVAIYVFARRQFKDANFILTYVGIAVGWVFTMICANQIFFLINPLKKQLKSCKKITLRICDILSFFVGTTLAVVTAFFQNWIMLNILGVCICVGSIKLFQFSSMKQGIISMSISVLIVVIATSVMHWTLDRSYNDYASQLASSLFLVVPDLITNLFKKCSWLPIIDVIIPGVFLSYLRGYDENYSTGWGGVYTIVGNISFLIGTIIWIPIEGVWFFSVPFSLVTYPSLIVGVFIIAYKRNQFKTLWTGRFNGPHNQFSQRIVEVNETRTTFGKLLTSDLLDEVKIRGSSDIVD